MLHLDQITKRFGETLALDRATLRVRPGTVHALLGENGAGKSTLMRIAFGMVQPGSGRVMLADETGTLAERRWRSPAEAIAAGVGMVHQHFALVPTLTVAENVALGAGAREGWRLDVRAWGARVHEIGRRTGLVLDPEAIAGDLPVGAQQRLEIVKALARDARLLVLDEPTAVLAPREAEDLLRWLRAFADAGHAAVLITHKLREALSVADDVTVLRAGRTVLATAAADATEPGLLAALLGGSGGPPRVEVAATPPAVRNHRSAGRSDVSPGDVPEQRPVEGGGAPPHIESATERHGEHHHFVAHGDEIARTPGTPIALARDLVLLDPRGTPRLNGATLTVHAGEIVGIAAVEGAGQHELLRALAGRATPASGELRTPARVAFVPEDRHHDALALEMSLVENVMLREAGEARGRIDWRGAARATRALMTAHDVRAADERVAARTLSGGNQQKLVLARELADDPSLVVAENPTRGLDVRATAAVHERLRAARDRGAGVVVYSSDLDEVIALADRVLVLYAGMVHESERSREAVGRLMVGA